MRRTIGLTALILLAAHGMAYAIGSGSQDPHNVLLVVVDDIGVDVLARYDEVPVGSCSEDPSRSCNSDADCAFCSGSSDSCVTDDNCAEGSCSVSGDACHSAADCSVPGEICVGGETCEGSCLHYPATPTIDWLADQGVLFRNAWSDATCTPTRRGIERGLYGIRTSTPPETTIADHLQAISYRTAAFGKFTGVDAPLPSANGYEHFAVDLNAGPHSYCLWERTVPPDSTACSTTYATKHNVDDAIAWLSGLSTAEEWFLLLAFNASHTASNGSHHNPPSGLTCPSPPNPDCDCDDGDGCDPDPLSCAGSQRECYLDVTEAMDDELARLLFGTHPSGAPFVDLDRTTVIFVADNGTPGDVISQFYETRKAKGSLYEGGINVPLIIRPEGGTQAWPPRESTALVNTTDIFATVLDLAGAPAPSYPTDSVSLKPILDNPYVHVRPYVFAQGQFDDASARTIRNRHFKLISRGSGEELYDLDAGGDVLANDLLAGGPGGLDPVQACNYERLQVGLQRIDEAPMFPQPDSFCGRLASECDSAPAADADGDCVSDGCDNCPSVCNSDQNNLPENDYGACQCPKQKSCKNGCSPSPTDCSFSDTGDSECWVGTALLACDPYENVFTKACACDGPPTPPWGGPVQPINCGDHLVLQCLVPAP
jgi:arylsulfatase A-like enzyme